MEEKSIYKLSNIGYIKYGEFNNILFSLIK